MPSPFVGWELAQLLLLIWQCMGSEYNIFTIITNARAYSCKPNMAYWFQMAKCECTS